MPKETMIKHCHTIGYTKEYFCISAQFCRSIRHTNNVKSYTSRCRDRYFYVIFKKCQKLRESNVLIANSVLSPYAL